MIKIAIKIISWKKYMLHNLLFSYKISKIFVYIPSSKREKSKKYIHVFKTFSGFYFAISKKVYTKLFDLNKEK